MRTTWSINTRGFKGAHFAVYPEELAERMILAGCPVSGIVLDPFAGSGTTAAVAKRSGRNYIGIELNEEYVNMAMQRVRG
jgi:DNA modification methylase